MHIRMKAHACTCMCAVVPGLRSRAHDVRTCDHASCESVEDFIFAFTEVVSQRDFLKDVTIVTLWRGGIRQLLQYFWLHVWGLFQGYTRVEETLHPLVEAA